MRIYDVADEAFRPYGQVLPGYDTAELLEAMRRIPMPEKRTAYEAFIPGLEACAIFREFSERAYGGMPVELGMCWGWNTKLNGLEYHRDSELNIALDGAVLLLARREEIVDGKLDSAKVKAFRLPKGAVVEVYATTLHFAPCHEDLEKGFKVAVVLPRGTNLARPVIEKKNEEDAWLFARNKWLLVHAEAPQAKRGAYVGITGKNIDISVD